MCEIFSNYLSYFKSEDTERSLPVKPVCPYICCYYKLILFLKFFYMGIKFVVLKNHQDLFSQFFYNLQRRELNYQ